MKVRRETEITVEETDYVDIQGSNLVVRSSKEGGHEYAIYFEHPPHWEKVQALAKELENRWRESTKWGR